MEMVKINASTLIADPKGSGPGTEDVQRGLAKFRAQSQHPINMLIASQLEALVVIAELHPDNAVGEAIYNAVLALFAELELT